MSSGGTPAVYRERPGGDWVDCWPGVWLATLDQVRVCGPIFEQAA